MLAAASVECGRAVTANEISRAVANSRVYAYNPSGGNTVSATHGKWPAPELVRIEHIVRESTKLVDLWECSPVQLLDNEGHTEEIIDVLFPDNPLLCVGRSNHEFDTRLREEWRGQLSAMPLIVPSPMSTDGDDPAGQDFDSHPGEHWTSPLLGRRVRLFQIHARDDKTPTVFAPLIESLASSKADTLDMGAAVLAHLARQAPLALAVYSGGKSLHGWFYCNGCDESRWEEFMRAAVRIGADPATWTRSQFVRMPDGQRDKGVCGVTRQVTYYFNPGVVK